MNGNQFHEALSGPKIALGPFGSPNPRIGEAPEQISRKSFVSEHFFVCIFLKFVYIEGLKNDPFHITYVFTTHYDIGKMERTN